MLHHLYVFWFCSPNFIFLVVVCGFEAHTHYQTWVIFIFIFFFPILRCFEMVIASTSVSQICFVTQFVPWLFLSERLRLICRFLMICIFVCMCSSYSNLNKKDFSWWLLRIPINRIMLLSYIFRVVYGIVKNSKSSKRLATFCIKIRIMSPSRISWGNSSLYYNFVVRYN